MNKDEFLKKLAAALSAMKRSEREKSIEYYREIIEDRTEEGLSEAEAVAELEDIPTIAEGILADAEARGALAPKHHPLSASLIAVGSPIWGALLIALIAVVFSIYVSAWAIIASLYAIALSLAIAGIAGAIGFVTTLAVKLPSALALLGAGLICASLGVFLLYITLRITRILAASTVRAIGRVRSRHNDHIGREKV